MPRKLIYTLLVLLLLADLGYSFRQHLSQPLDGDMAWNLVPGAEVKPILENPLGTGIILKHQAYANPNRFFSHYSMKEYYETVPLFLQKFVPRIDSYYLAGAIVKIILQLVLILLLATAITGSFNLLRLDFMFAAVLVTPLFQTEGYQSYMGIIDRAPTYVFFYALPFAFLVIYFLPFILQNFYGRKPVALPLIYLLWIPLALVICLSGPLNPGVALILSLLMFCEIIIRNYLNSHQPGFLSKVAASVSGIPRNYLFYLVPVSIFSLYSLYIGRFNTLNFHLPLTELYAKLPAGIYIPLIKKLGFPVLLLVIAGNYFFIRRNPDKTGSANILRVMRWAGIFILMYILLLPLGGYREYRPHILRYDTIMPVTVCLVFIFGLSTLFLVKNIPARQKRWYIAGICGVLLFFTINDESHFDKNRCERDALKEISESKQDTVRLHCDCSVLLWKKSQNFRESELNSQLLTLWGITRGNKPFTNE